MAGQVLTRVQPQGIARVQRRNPVAHGLVFLNSGADLTDATGRTKPTAVNAPARSKDNSGVVLQLVATSQQYIEIGTAPAIDAIVGPLTLLCAFNTDYAIAQLIAKDSDVGGRGFTFDIDSSYLRFYVNGGGSPGVNQINSASPLAANTDYLAIVTYDPAAGATLYINGTVSATAAMNAAIPASTTTTKIGARAYAGFAGYFNGKIGQAGIWNRALSGREVREIYDARWNLFEPPVRGIRFKPGGTGTVRRALYLRPFA